MATTANKTTDVKKVSDTLNAAFLPGPVDKFQFSNCSQELINNFYFKRVQQFIEADSEIIEINDFNAVAIWVAPGKTYPSAQWDEPNECVDEFKKKAKVIIEDYQYDKIPHWTLVFIGKDPSQNKGSISPLINPYLSKAKEQDVPVLLFAVNDHAKDIYIHFGFKVLATIKIGEGKVDSNGDRDSNGVGLAVYMMAYNHKDRE
ncbi:hypothetical protein BN7_1791 [Wickerhamomyces ciferrii]|uniref:N-acetyltransferase domain-containing protein n=1 Tax=Wickerhamomyces ciferrii (strain ATCC 14091 / BCRC 22168 / CBS 111 / JCM 3599 / NBRC 0793 / NRRL Y-1031 F-60-10) TaxID=1206466 RepID=K0KJE6_WICCF|nr:uncharacterized protein BN7_1791 [Wickerhamomyces ciferrii]CCH42247.1 hypothetical protein BN7_1791 [Wickerhamomyces ciferrii]